MSQIEQLDLRQNIFLLTNISLQFRPPSLVSALIHFERGDEVNRLIETEKAKEYLKGRIEADPLISPNYLSNLLICYALEGDREQMETAILNVREQTSFLKWKYMYEAEFEFKIAAAHLIAGDKDAAIESLTRADKLDDHDLLLKQELNLWFIFDRLRGNPRFDKLLD